MAEIVKFIYVMIISFSLFLVVTKVDGKSLYPLQFFIITLYRIFYHIIITFFYSLFPLQPFIGVLMILIVHNICAMNLLYQGVKLVFVYVVLNSREYTNTLLSHVLSFSFIFDTE